MIWSKTAKICYKTVKIVSKYGQKLIKKCKNTVRNGQKVVRNGQYIMDPQIHFLIMAALRLPESDWTKIKRLAVLL